MPANLLSQFEDAIVETLYNSAAIWMPGSQLP